MTLNKQTGFVRHKEAFQPICDCVLNRLAPRSRFHLESGCCCCVTVLVESQRFSTRPQGFLVRGAGALLEASAWGRWPSAAWARPAPLGSLLVLIFQVFMPPKLVSRTLGIYWFSQWGFACRPEGCRRPPAIFLQLASKQARIVRSLQLVLSSFAVLLAFRRLAIENITWCIGVLEQQLQPEHA